MAKKPAAKPSTQKNLSIPLNSQTLLVVLLVVMAFFTGYLFFKVQSLQKGGATETAPQAGAENQTALLVDSLKNYAKDLKLDTQKFNSCLDNGETAEYVANDVNQANGLGIGGTPAFFVNGRKIGGAFPFEAFKELIDKELTGNTSNDCADYANSDLKNSCGTTADASFNPIPVEVAVGDAPSVGTENPKVTIVEFSDFQCPYCGRAFPTVKQILDEYPNDVKLYYKHLPLVSIHPQAQKAAEASMCANQQGKFWEYHDKLFKVQGY